MTAREWIDEQLDGEEAMVADGFDDCIVGIVNIFTQRLVLYDVSKVIHKLIDMGMTREEAEEHFNFNMLGAYVGKGTPAFAEMYEERPDV